MHTLKIEPTPFLSPRRVPALALAVFTLFIAAYVQPAPAAQSAQSTFNSAEDAGEALFHAVQNDNTRVLTNILGAENEFVTAGDETEDKADRERFVQKYQQMHRLVRVTHGEVLLYIGAENWPFPVPLVWRDGEPVPFHGYFFHVLPGSRGGFSAIAYPYEYRSSGVMTFVINQDGVVREKDLGPDTRKLAGTLVENPGRYPLGRTWKPVDMPN